jgi:hypothetical protein
VSRSFGGSMSDSLVIGLLLGAAIVILLIVVGVINV